MDLSQFEAFEIQPCVLLNEQGQPIHVSYEPCEPGDPDLAEYVLYGRTPGQGVTALADFASEELAEMFRDLLLVKQRADTTQPQVLYAAVNLSARRIVILPHDPMAVVPTVGFYPVVSEDADVCTDLNWAARQVVEARVEFDNPAIHLYQLVPVDPALAEPALAVAEKAWAEDNDDHAD